MLQPPPRAVGFVSVLPSPQDVNNATVSCDLATTMVLRWAVGALAGAAAARKGTEAVWASAGFFLGAALGQYGIVTILAAALWKKAE